ncbi:hypothetical protein GCM10020255_085380 [Rhodococcus baikonurensis]
MGIGQPWYTRRMQKALGYEGDDVVTIFKGLQLDIGAPPQFMDFRYRVDDPLHGEFWLDHCGALMDVEPLGDEFVTSMCHDIEDPTFDATAIATNPHAQIRPIHRPPRRPADRHPHCAWTVSIDPSHRPPVMTAHTEQIGRTAAVTVELSPIDHGGDGRADYSGPLLSDLRFSDFSRSALVRIAEEICVQHHLLALGFLAAVRRRADEDKAREITRKQLTGIAGVAAQRIRDALGLPSTLESLALVLSVHPLLNPKQYVESEIRPDGGALELWISRDALVDRDGGWPTLLGSEHLDPLQALVRGVNPHFTVRVVAEDAAGSFWPSTSPKLLLRNASKSPLRRSVPARPSYSKIAEFPCLCSSSERPKPKDSTYGLHVRRPVRAFRRCDARSPRTDRFRRGGDIP